MRFELYPLQKKIIQEKLRYDKRLRRIFKKKPVLNEQINQEIHERLNDKNRPNWAIIQITGETGEFKSSTGITIAKTLLDPNFTTKQITMQYTEFQEKMSKSKPRQTLMLDEQIFQRGLGSTRIRENMLNIIETLRQRQNSLVLITPREKFITDDYTTFTLEPCGFNKETKTVRCLVKKHNYLGFYHVKLLWKKPIWEDYQKIKKEFLELTKTQHYKKYDYDQIAKELLKKMPEEYKKKSKRITLYVEKNSGNITKEERDLLTEQLKIMIENEAIT